MGFIIVLCVIVAFLDIQIRPSTAAVLWSHNQFVIGAQYMFDYSPCYSSCVASPARNPPGRPRLDGSVHKEAHPSFSYFLMMTTIIRAARMIYHVFHNVLTEFVCDKIN